MKFQGGTSVQVISARARRALRREKLHFTRLTSDSGAASGEMKMKTLLDGIVSHQEINKQKSTIQTSRQVQLLILQYVPVRLLFSLKLKKKRKEKKEAVFFPLEPSLKQWRPFFPPCLRCWRSSRGKSVSAGLRGRKGKQEGWDTLPQQPGLTINISFYKSALQTMPCSSVSRCLTKHIF